jgi:hypothetical protein
MMVMVVMMMVMPVRADHDARTAVGVVVMVMMVVRRELDLSIPGRRGLLFVDGQQQGAGIRDWLQQIGVGIGLQCIRRRWSRRGLRRTKRSERGHRSQYSGNLSFQGVLLCVNSPATQLHAAEMVPAGNV